MHKQRILPSTLGRIDRIDIDQLMRCRRLSCPKASSLPARSCRASLAKRLSTILAVCAHDSTELILSKATDDTGGHLNRVSFLRPNHPFLSAAVKHPSTSFLVFKNLAPLGRDLTRLEFLSYQEVKLLIGTSGLFFYLHNV